MLFSPNLTPAHRNPYLFICSSISVTFAFVCWLRSPHGSVSVLPEKARKSPGALFYCWHLECLGFGADFLGLENLPAFVIYKKMCEAFSPPKSPGVWEILFLQGLWGEERKPEAA